MQNGELSYSEVFPSFLSFFFSFLARDSFGLSYFTLLLRKHQIFFWFIIISAASRNPIHCCSYNPLLLATRRLTTTLNELDRERARTLESGDAQVMCDLFAVNKKNPNLLQTDEVDDEQ